MWIPPSLILIRSPLIHSNRAFQVTITLHLECSDTARAVIFISGYKDSASEIWIKLEIVMLLRVYKLLLLLDINTIESP